MATSINYGSILFPSFFLRITRMDSMGYINGLRARMGGTALWISTLCFHAPFNLIALKQELVTTHHSTRNLQHRIQLHLCSRLHSEPLMEPAIYITVTTCTFITVTFPEENLNFIRESNTGLLALQTSPLSLSQLDLNNKTA